MHLPWWLGFVISVGLALFRYRFPTLHPRFASAGFGACLFGACGGVSGLDNGLLASLVINGALAAALLDYAFVGKAATSERQISPHANLTVNFLPDRPPVEVANQNVHSWYATSLQLTSVDADGAKQRVVFNQWVLAAWFAGDIYDYQVTFKSLSGEQVNASVCWRSERGIFALVESPDQPTVLQIKVEARQA